MSRYINILLSMVVTSVIASSSDAPYTVHVTYSEYITVKLLCQCYRRGMNELPLTSTARLVQTESHLVSASVIGLLRINCTLR